MAAPLTPYPFPPGMAIPRLMPFQEYPWNGDHFLAAEVLRLKAAHGLNVAIETGTCLGSTTLWLEEALGYCYTFEVHEPYFNIACARFRANGCIDAKLNNSADGLSRLWDYLIRDVRPFIFLDAHWQDKCPLLDELDAIAKRPSSGHTVLPCILIHDFQVPGTDFGYDSMPDGRPFNLELITPSLERIYGIFQYKINYPTQVAGAMRGWISVEPCS